MDILKDFSIGLVSVLKITGAPMLYRYPYRISGEGLRADWNNIGQDIESVIGRLAEATHERPE
jgi:hypothetical protein